MSKSIAGYGVVSCRQPDRIKCRGRVVVRLL
jgi:hypothetical protein